MIKLENISLYDLLPPNLHGEKEKALATAWDKEYRKVCQLVLRASMVFGFVMELDEEMADHLCLSLDIKGYKADLSLDKKRLLIRSALLNYARLGTKAAVEDAVGIIHGGTTVQENWEYSGKPYYFRVAVDAGQEKVVGEGVAIGAGDHLPEIGTANLPGIERKLSPENPVGRLLDTIMEYKNVRSWLQGITVDVIEPGTIHTAALPEVGMSLIVDPYRVKELVTGGTVHPKAMAVAGNYLIVGK